MDDSLNPAQREAITALETWHPEWEFWLVTTVVGPDIWCGRLRADHKKVLNESSPESLSAAIGESGWPQ